MSAVNLPQPDLPAAASTGETALAPSSRAERIEILSVELLDQNRPVVEELKELARSLRLEFGWHYLLDLSWIIQNLGPAQGVRILEAGAGSGMLQWYLADNGAQVLSVDRLSRAALPPRFRRRFRLQGLRPEDLLSDGRAFTWLLQRPLPGPFYHRAAARLVHLLREGAAYLFTAPCTGQVVIYNQELSELVDLPDNSIDAVVSISALEHNTPEGLERVVAELMRVLKPGGALLATLTAAPDQDWWHEASSGWCYSEASLRRIFRLPESAPSNYNQYNQLFTALQDCAELRDGLARFYSQADDKGMPQGVWKPEYQPVGVYKIKRA
jgi:SAM-dependent methyltransferase